MKQNELGLSYRRFLCIAKSLNFLPESVALWLLHRVANRISPLLWEEEALREGVVAAGRGAEWPRIWKRILEDHGIFCFHATTPHVLNPSWVRRHVRFDPIPLNELLSRGNGCLFLTYHHIFSHLLLGVLGICGYRVDGLAAPEESSPIYDVIGPYIHRLHRANAKKFNGGDYLFFRSPREAVRLAKESLGRGSLLISLNDVPVSKIYSSKGVYSLLGRSMPVASGSIRLAARMETPIVAGALLREGNRYHLKYHRLDERQPYQMIHQAYFDNLHDLLKANPQCWEGWRWFGKQQPITQSPEK